MQEHGRGGEMSRTSTLRFTTVAIAVVFSVYAAMVISDLIRAHAEAAPYFISDWQINYAGGFVRRGLLGEFARLLFVHFAIDTRTTIVVMQTLSYVVFFVASTMLLAPVLVRHTMFAFAVFSPITIAFKALESGGGTTGAKDIVFLALLAVQAVLSTRARTDPSASDRRLLILAVVWGAVTLVHEGFFFYLPFPIAMLILTARRQIRPFKLGLIALPAFSAFIMSTAFHGDARYGAAICASLGAGAPAGCEKTGAITWLTRPSMQYLMSTYYVIVQPPYILLTSALVAMLGGVGLALVALDREIAKWTVEALKNRGVFIMTIACIALPIPVFAASDHGRFLHIWFTSALIVLAAFVSRKSDCEMTPSTAEQVPWKDGVLTRALWLTLFVAYVISWSAQGNCCPDRLRFGFLGRIFLFVVERWA
jgi:hypothetical protein